MNQLFLILGSAFILTELFGKVYGKSIREQFHETFLEKCFNKYDFVQKFLDLQFNSAQQGRYIIFTYHENNLKNGGFGDRLGGLITAVSLAIRFNRQLIIEAKNSMHQYFRPYHLEEIVNGYEDDNSTYLWSNAKVWSGFNEWKKSHKDYKRNIKSYEADYSDCVSVDVEGFTAEHTRHCAFISGDIQAPIIKFASNRAYLCLYENETATVANIDYHDILHLNENVDLFEVAGCMARLVLWPTQKFWSEIDNTFVSLANTQIDNLTKDIENTKSREKKQKSLRKKDKLFSKLLNQYTLQSNPVYQIGVHLRCGDYWSYRTYLLNSDGYDRYACILDTDTTDYRNYQYHPDQVNIEDKSHYLKAGNPIGLGTCAKTLIQNTMIVVQRNLDSQTRPRREDATIHSEEISVTGEFITNYRDIYINLLRAPSSIDSLLSEDTAVMDVEGATTSTEIPTTIRKKSSLSSSVFKSLTKKSSILVYITSDNIRAEEQIRNFTSHKYSLISPQGCHIEYDPSPECYLFTITHWFLLSLSPTIISQTFGEFNAPTSSFSRYAGIYGLYSEYPFHSGRYCEDDVFNTFTLSRIHQGNWFCQADPPNLK